MSEIKDGGPAFPHDRQRWDDPFPTLRPSHDGMSLRDYFASHAPISLEMAMEMLNVRGALQICDDDVRANVFEQLAQLRNEFADAMIEARARTQEGQP